MLLLGESNHMLPSEMQVAVGVIAQKALTFLPTDNQIKWMAWVGGILLSLAGAALTLLVSWHFNESNLPQRIEDLKRANMREHLLLQPVIVAVARRGIGPVIPNIEGSRLTQLRKWFSGWNEKERARVLAASASQIAKEASALRMAAQEAEQRQITAHLIRGYQTASQGDDEAAFEEFESAVKVAANDRLSRDIAAGWARKINKQQRELHLLGELKMCAAEARSDLDHARALRREAELIEKRQSPDDLREARDLLILAGNLLRPIAGDEEARIELGRVLTLFCEVQCSRRRVGRLDWLNGPLPRARTCLTEIRALKRPEEPEGEAYGEERLDRLVERIAELRETADDNGSSDTPEPADDASGGERSG